MCVSVCLSVSLSLSLSLSLSFRVNRLDDANYWNHSDKPNTNSDGEDRMSTYAARDIEAGEELLDDYDTYEYPQWFVDLGKRYGREEGKF